MQQREPKTEMMKRHKRVESMKELSSNKEINNLTDRSTLEKQTGGAENQSHGRNNAVFLDRYHNTVTADRTWTDRQADRRSLTLQLNMWNSTSSTTTSWKNPVIALFRRSFCSKA